MRASVLNRKVHRWGAVLIALPLLIVVTTGILLQLKKDIAWIQPPTRRGSGQPPAISFAEILKASRGVPEAAIGGWTDIDRLDVRPSKGIVKVRAKNRWEVQLDLATAEVVQVAQRRSDVIESLHDGSWFHDKAKLWVFLPGGCILLALWVTGLYLFFLPQISRRRRNRRRTNAAAST